MWKTFELFAGHLKAVIFFYIIIQIIILITVPISYSSDSLYYYKLAQQSITAHSFYPAPEHLFEDYIIAPLYINILIIVLFINNSVFSIGILNVFSNLIQLYFVYKLTEKIFSKNAAKTAAILYMFYFNSLGFILMNMTELVFNCFILGSIYFYLKGSKKSYFISGLLVGAAIGVRPIGWVLIIIYTFIVCNELFKKKKNIKPLLVLAGTVLFILIFGSTTYLSFGDFVFTSNNGPVNVLVGANNNATGAYNASVFNEGNSGYINMPQLRTFYEKENYWKIQAQNWILKHPFKWISLFPMKLVYIFAWDDITLSNFFDFGSWNLYRVVKEVSTTRSIKNILLEFPVYEKIFFICIQIFHHLYYFFIMWMFYNFILSVNKKLIMNEGVIIPIGFIILGLLINLITFGDARFKYPYLILIIVLISPKVYELVSGKYSSKINTQIQNNA